MRASYNDSAGDLLLVEYLVQSNSVYSLYKAAVSTLVTKCKSVSADVTFTSSTYDGEVHLPSFGQWNRPVMISNYSSEVHSQLGYLFTRKGTYLVVVAYENPGKLNVKTLENFARQALAKLKCFQAVIVARFKLMA